MSDAERLLLAGFRAHRAGELALAERCYRQAAAQAPGEADCRHLLGLVCHQNGRHEEGVAWIRQALALRPHFPEAWTNLGILLKHLDRLGEAEAAHRRALSENPAHAEAHFNLAMLLRNVGRRDEALEALRRTVALRPDHVAGWCNLASWLNDRQEAEEAATCANRALALAPDLAEGYVNLGIALALLERTEAAETALRRALALDPRSVEACVNLAGVARDRGRPEEGITLLRRAADLAPDKPWVHWKLGLELFGAGEGEEARAALRRALDRDPGCAEAALSLAMAQVPVGAGEGDLVTVRFREALTALEAWAEQGRWAALGRVAGMFQPFHLAYRDGNHREAMAHYGRLICRARAAAAGETPPSPPGRPRVRLGVVSGHIRNHSVWFIILRGLLTHLDRGRFEVALFHTSPVQDRETERARSLVDRFHQAPQKDWRELVWREAPDVLFYPEVGMDIDTLKLASLRLAPLQAASWGHPLTTGLPTMDLFFSGQWLEADDAQSHYVEKLHLLPGAGACTLPPAEESATPDVVWPEARDVPRFLVCQNVIKLDPAYDALYPRLARAAGPCRFWFVKSDTYPWAFSPFLARLHQAFRAEGLDPGDYLRVLPWQTLPAFRGLLDQVDLYLDTPAFSGFTTAWQALHRGVPVVTWEGPWLRRRLAAGLLRKLGITDTIARDEAHYVAVAARLARDPDARGELARRIRANRHLLDGDLAVVRAFEKAILENRG